MSLEKIKLPIRQELNSLGDRVREYFDNSDVELLSSIAEHVFATEGKQIRPTISFLISKMICGEVTEEVYSNAIFLETIHVSSLIHDDVVDKADTRRSKKTTNSIWGNSVAVLFGDYLFAKALELVAEQNNPEILKVGTRIISNMTKGELLQIEKSESLNTNYEDYLNIIKWKTGTLLESCALLVAINLGVDAQTKNKLSKLGQNIGLMFQIVDDIIDYSSTQKSGKTQYADILDRKITIPMLMAFEAQPEKREQIVALLKNDNVEQHIKTIVDFVNQNKGIDKSLDILNSYKIESLEILNSFPDSDSKTSLIDLIEFLINRKY